MNVFRKLKNRGFSLIELMIVVAIIGILAAIALPNFTRFQRKARQSEAKGLLGSYHTALKSSAAEIGCFRGNFVVIGFQPEGELYYRLSASNNALCTLPTATAAITDDTCINTSNGCAGITTNYIKSWSERANAVRDPTTAGTVTNNNYIASSAGFLGSASGQNDQWEINENKTIVNRSSGL